MIENGKDPAEKARPTGGRGIAPTAKASRLNRAVGRTAKKEVRRQQLIDATIESIAKFGISGTTMATVTSFAGLSTGTVNFHFESKQTLFEETLRFLGNEHFELWNNHVAKAELNAEAKLLAIVDAHCHPTVASRKKLTVWFAFYGEAANRVAYRDIMSSIDGDRRRVSTELCREIITKGGYEDRDPEHVTQTLEALYDGFCLNILIYPQDYARQDIRRRVRDYLSITFPRHFEPAAALEED